MFFSKNKKLQRDRNAGLVFRWRGGSNLNKGGSAIAFFMTVLIFASGFVLLKVYAKQNTVPSRYRASIVQLGEINDEQTWWIERNSPFLPEWSDDGNESGDQRVNQLLEKEIAEQHNAANLYRDVKMKEVEIASEKIYALDRLWLPAVEDYRISEQENQPQIKPVTVNWELKLEASDSLKKRLPANIAYGGWIPRKWRGRTVSVIVVVNKIGKIINVNSTEWTEDKTVKQLVNWVYTLSLKPTKNNSPPQTGILKLSYSPIIQKETKEEQP